MYYCSAASLTASAQAVGWMPISLPWGFDVLPRPLKTPLVPFGAPRCLLCPWIRCTSSSFSRSLSLSLNSVGLFRYGERNEHIQPSLKNRSRRSLPERATDSVGVCVVLRVAITPRAGGWYSTPGAVKCEDDGSPLGVNPKGCSWRRDPTVRLLLHPSPQRDTDVDWLLSLLDIATYLAVAWNACAVSPHTYIRRTWSTALA